VAAEMNTIEGLLATARRGGGATIVPRLALSMPGASAGVAAVRLSRPTPRRRVGLLRRASGRAVRAADAFAAALRSVLSGRDDTATPAAAPSAVRK
jgi:DNA-binding transcriptional LysR family regulator